VWCCSACAVFVVFLLSLWKHLPVDKKAEGESLSVAECRYKLQGTYSRSSSSFWRKRWTPVCICDWSETMASYWSKHGHELMEDGPCIYIYQPASTNLYWWTCSAWPRHSVSQEQCVICDVWSWSYCKTHCESRYHVPQVIDSATQEDYCMPKNDLQTHVSRFLFL
jgi:hypothetical protein